MGLLLKNGIGRIGERFIVKLVIDFASKGDHLGSELVAGLGIHRNRPLLWSTSFSKSATGGRNGEAFAGCKILARSGRGELGTRRSQVGR